MIRVRRKSLTWLTNSCDGSADLFYQHSLHEIASQQACRAVWVQRSISAVQSILPFEQLLWPTKGPRSFGLRPQDLSIKMLWDLQYWMRCFNFGGKMLSFQGKATKKQTLSVAIANRYIEHDTLSISFAKATVSRSFWPVVASTAAGRACSLLIQERLPRCTLTLRDMVISPSQAVGNDCKLHRSCTDTSLRLNAATVHWKTNGSGWLLYTWTLYAFGSHAEVDLNELVAFPRIEHAKHPLADTQRGCLEWAWTDRRF